MALELRGFEVSLVAEAVEALQAIRTRKFDLILLDNLMPDMSGVELCRTMRAAKVNSPIVFLSGAR